uniref:Cytochrome P450 n=1 Tax=Oryza punctata TaxID=4537 RepID=A0A0E0M5X1_ORYPU
MAFFLPVAFSLFLAVISSYVVQLLADARRRLPPGPWPLPLIGNLHQLDHLPHRSLARLAARHGPLMSLRLGAVRTVVVSSPAMARKVLERHNADIAARSIGDSMRASGHCENSVLCLPPRRRWRALRRLSTIELFSPRRLDVMRTLRQEKVAELVRHVSDHAARGEAVDVGSSAHVAALGLLSRTMFSVDLDPEPAREVSDIVDEASVLAAGPNISDFFPAIAPADIQGVRRRMAMLVRRMYAIIDEQIERRMHGRAAGEPRKNDLLDVMLDKEGENQEDGNEINRDAIRGLFTDLFTGGETTSHTIECAIAELLQCPNSMRKVQEELKSVIGTKQQIDEDDITKLPYLQAVIKETLRLHPPVPLPPYEAEATVEIQGYTIPKGAKVLVNLWTINRCADAWIEPDKFMPERFLDSDISFMGRDFQLIPFGAGRRICLGLPLAHRMVHLMLGSLLHRFTWTLPAEAEKNGVDMRERFGLALSFVVPLYVMAQEIQ